MKTKKQHRQRLRQAFEQAPSPIPIGSTLDLMLGPAVTPPSAFELRWGACVSAAEWAREFFSTRLRPGSMDHLVPGEDQPQLGWVNCPLCGTELPFYRLETWSAGTTSEELTHCGYSFRALATPVDQSAWGAAPGWLRRP